MIYLVVFFLSTLLLYLAERADTTNAVRRLLIWFGVLLPVVLAGLRASSVGTDVEVYGVYAYEKVANSSSFLEYYSTSASSSDRGFYLVTYIVARLFRDYHWGLFAYAFLVQLFVYLGFCRYKQLLNTEIWFGMLLYYLTLYNFSLNLLRQSIAVAIIFFATSFIFERKYIRFFLLFIIAMTFHSSAIMGICILAIYLLFRQENDFTTAFWIILGMFMLIAAVIAVTHFEDIIQALVGAGIVRDTYLKYISGGEFVVTNGSVSLIGLIRDSTFLGITIVCFDELKRRRLQVAFFVVVSCLVVVSNFVPLFAQYMDRIFFYIIQLQLVNIDNMASCIEKNSRKIWYVGITALLTIIWWREFISLGYAETFPFRFFWQ